MRLRTALGIEEHAFPRITQITRIRRGRAENCWFEWVYKPILNPLEMTQKKSA